MSRASAGLRRFLLVRPAFGPDALIVSVGCLRWSAGKGNARRQVWSLTRHARAFRLRHGSPARRCQSRCRTSRFGALAFRKIGQSENLERRTLSLLRTGRSGLNLWMVQSSILLLKLKTATQRDRPISSGGHRIRRAKVASQTPCASRLRGEQAFDAFITLVCFVARKSSPCELRACAVLQ